MAMALGTGHEAVALGGGLAGPIVAGEVSVLAADGEQFDVIVA